MFKLIYQQNNISIVVFDCINLKVVISCTIFIVSSTILNKKDLVWVKNGMMLLMPALKNKYVLIKIKPPKICQNAKSF